MIRGVHTMFYSSEPEALRAFLRDKLGFKGCDVGDGWLIFNLPEADMGCHPADAEEGAPSGTPSISFYCDDIEKTVAELKREGRRVHEAGGGPRLRARDLLQGPGRIRIAALSAEV